jgi:hypothetical protein
MRKIERGTVVDAYERFYSPTNRMRYRVDGGWVSHFRCVTSTEPQIEVDIVRVKIRVRIRVRVRFSSRPSIVP